MTKKPTRELTIYLRDLGQGGNRVGEGYRVLAELVHVEVVNTGEGSNTDYVVVPLKSNEVFAYNGDFPHWTRRENNQRAWEGRS